MRIHLITGGARAGKSRYAQQRAATLGGDEVSYVATAQGMDEEMRRRIATHRAERPRAWQTLESPIHAGAAIRSAPTSIVVLDCLTVLLSNALIAARAGDENQALAAMEREASGVLSGAAARDGDLFIVTNEVGCGVHPETALGRWFRDGLGHANQRIALNAREVVMMVCGLPVAVR